MANPKEANFRIVRYNGEYMIEVLDKVVGHWYIVACHIKKLWQAVELCNKYDECEIEDDGIIGKDYIPTDWVERLEEHGLWEIVRKDSKPTLTVEDIESILNIESEYQDETPIIELRRMGYREYCEEILKRYNNEKTNEKHD